MGYLRALHRRTSSGRRRQEKKAAQEHFKSLSNHAAMMLGVRHPYCELCRRPVGEVTIEGRRFVGGCRCGGLRGEGPGSA